MDNITHTLVGALVAQTWNSVRERRAVSSPAVTTNQVSSGTQGQASTDSVSAHALFWAVVLGSNLPDLDFMVRFLPGVTSQGKNLVYLLHHRGWTHTFLFLPLLAFFCAVLVLWGQRIRTPRTQRLRPQSRTSSRYKDFKFLSFAAAVGLVLHLAADFCNDYGVHPFSPFWDRWFYGDALFIIEPSLWWAMIPWVIQMAQPAWVRATWAFLGLAILVAAWVLPLVAFPVALGVTVWAVLVSLLQWRFKGPWPAWGATVGVLWVFIVCGAVARAQARQTINRLAPTEQLTDLILTPLPGNPFCRRLLALSIDGEGTYRGRIGMQSIWPKAFAPEKCVFRFERSTAKAAPAIEHAAPWDEPTLLGTDRIAWQGEFSGSLDLLLELVRANCKLAATLHFIRAPYWKAGENGGLQVGDLRYDRDRSGGFSSFEVQGQEQCGWMLPVWEMPFFRHYHRDIDGGGGWD